MNCIRMPLSLDDARAIVECYGGPYWREAMVQGLYKVAIFAAIVFVVSVVVVMSRREDGSAER